VFDASAVLAMLLEEPGAAAAARLMEEGDAVILSVNYAEVAGKLLARGVSEADFQTAWHNLPIEVAALDAEVALGASRLVAATRELGLSLGDRCCLAFAASRHSATVVTADRAWKKLKRFDIAAIR
jgi:PIN domain nuclease of toxin-antitoxin system